MLKEATENSIIDRKNLFSVSFLLINALAWYFMTLTIFNNVLASLNVTESQNIVIWTAYYATIIGSGVIGAILSSKVNKIGFLFFWIILGTLVSSFPALFSNPTVMQTVVLAILLGGSFGIGMPLCLAYFADFTTVENRGLMGGIIFLITNLTAPLLFLIASSVPTSSIVTSVVLVVWRATGLLVFFLKLEEKNVSKTMPKSSFKLIFNDKSFLLYFVAWFMFMLIDRSEAPTLRFILSDLHYYVLAPIIGSISALVAGFLADRIGRKRMVIYGFVTFGIAYAVIGIAPDLLLSRYFFLAIESISTGILWVAFFLILWGDLSKYGTRAKYYSIGTMPFFLTSIIQLFSGPYFMEIPNTSAFSLAAFFLFIAVLPLLYAPETLPEKKMELRRLRKYVEAAKKAKGKQDVKG